ncbi:MAG: hypothetical protein HY791_26470 [Deltaproteobacteria bacterium]|nr:hypothetical protein [Deltaproteobacteria bacterium]
MQTQPFESTHRTQRAEPTGAVFLGRDGAATLHRVGELNVLCVSGDFREMGRQHGSLLRAEIPKGPLPYFRTYVERLMGPKLGRVSPFVWPVLQRLIGKRVEERMPEFIKETLAGLAEGSGRPLAELMQGATMPDALLWLVSRVMDVERPGPAVEHRMRLGLGCTSAIAWGAATKDGRLLHARNFDYHGVASWPRTATVIFHDPKDDQKYVSVSAAGVPLGGITAMNESGLTLTVHQHMFTDKTKLGGMPIGVVGDLVMRKARNLDDAERILGEYTHIGCWTYLVADGRSKQVLCWEENPQRKAPRRTSSDDTTFGYANTYLDQELGETEVNLYGSYWRNNMRRHQRAHELLRLGAGAHDAQSLARILGDTGKIGCRLSGSISMLMTVGSVVFRPEDGALWVASGSAPTSHRRFLPFSLTTKGYAPELGTLEPNCPENPALLEAFDRYRDAYVLYTDAASVSGARAELERATQLAPMESLYQAAAGYLAVREGDARGAERAFGRALEIGHHDEERRAAFELWRGRSLDLLGERAGARAAYRRSLSMKSDPQIRKAALRSLSRPYEASAARSVHPDLSFADVVSP